MRGSYRSWFPGSGLVRECGSLDRPAAPDNLRMPPDTWSPADTDTDIDRRFTGVARLYGAAAAALLRDAHATIVGLGGVGSWVAEALARCGIGALTLIDLDHIAESNTNRQVHALEREFGKAKVLAMRDRIAQISPRCRVTCIEEFVTPDNVASLIPPTGVVIDCIDQVAAKAALVAHCRTINVAVIVCGAGGGRTDPTRIANGDLARATGDPLLAKVRYRLRKHFGYPRDNAKRIPKFGVTAVYSDEPVRVPSGGADAGAGLACAGYGSSVVVTASLGFAAAARAIDVLTRENPPSA
jgi:tRNA threonylcarbamoyladenosine dehydratase